LQAAVSQDEKRGAHADADDGVFAGARKPRGHNKFARKTA
jgi:hypothetical protein